MIRENGMRLYQVGKDNENFFKDIDDAVRSYIHDLYEGDDNNAVYDVEIHVWDVEDAGICGDSRLPTGKELLETVIEDFLDDAGLLGIDEDYQSMLNEPRIIIAFDDAIAAMKMAQNFWIARDHIGTITQRVSYVSGAWRW